MKKNYLFYLTTIIILLLSNLSFSQSTNTKNLEMEDVVKEKIVQQLNTPQKVWIKGYWIINLEGHRIWEKGYWTIEEKTFQEKSKMLRRKLNNQNRV